MLIDFHTHLFPDRIAEKTISYLSQKGGIPAYADGTLAGLQRALKKASADLGIALPVLTRPESFDSVLSFAAQVNEGYFKGEHDVLSFGCIHPDCEDVEEKMAKIKSMGFLGIKLHPDYQQTFFDDEKTIRILKAAEKEDLIVLTHAGYDVGYPELTHCTPRHILNVLNKIGDGVKLVLAHYGSGYMHDEVYELLAGKNVYFDTAYVLFDITKETFFKILEKHGEDKILFASDSPWRSIKDTLDLFKSYRLPKATEEKILYKNALSLLGDSVIRK